jgi:hypothetical protein
MVAILKTGGRLVRGNDQLPCGVPMLWFHSLAYFVGGVFFANFVPHFVSGVLGRSFPTPFGKPPFRGLSSSPVNVLYGLGNLAIAYTLLSRVGDFALRNAFHAGVFGLGLALWSLMIARSLARLRSG